MKAVLYLRVSTDEQAASGAGLDAQHDAALACAERAGWEVLGPFADEGVSGATGLDKRPALLEAVAALGKGDVLLVAKRDRLGREPIAVAMIEAAVARRQARVVSAAGEGTADDDPSSILMRRMVDAFAEYERLLIKSRTRSALAAKRARGERTGQIPYGWHLAVDGKTLVPDVLEREVIEGIRRWHQLGWSMRKIARELTLRRVATKNGRPSWSHMSVIEILARESPDGSL